MKRFAMMALVLALTTAACTKDDDNTNPVAPSGTVTFGAQMSAAQEVPAAAPPENTAAGTARFTMVPTGGGAYSATLFIQVGGLVRAGVLPAPLDNGSVIVAGHIHNGPAGVAGPVVLGFPISLLAPLVSPTGSIVVQFSNIAVPADVASAILANPAGFYINLHSAINAAGVVRGQLVRQ